MTIGGPEHAAEGARAILDGIKTATSSPFWDYPDGRIPFAGALSVLLGGAGEPLAIVETVRVEVKRFGEINEEFARAYGEGERTLAWWRRVIGDWYCASARRAGATFSDETEIVCEWIAVARRL